MKSPWAHRLGDGSVAFNGLLAHHPKQAEKAQLPITAPIHACVLLIDQHSPSAMPPRATIITEDGRNPGGAPLLPSRRAFLPLLHTHLLQNSLVRELGTSMGARR